MPRTTPQSATGTPAAAGFTLIELLVVISIIALLVSLMLPSLANGREVARKVTCASQLKQITLSHLMYADAHKGWFPIGNWATQAAWGQDRSATSYADQNLSIKEWYGNNLNLFVCPTHTYMGNGSSSSLNDQPGNESNISGYRMLIASYRITAARFNRATTTWTFYGGHPVYTSGPTTIVRNDNKILCLIPNINFAGTVRTDPDNGNKFYIHPPDMMPLAMNGRNMTNTTWTPYAAASPALNNHASLDGINVSFLDGHQTWAVQNQGPNRMQMYGTGGFHTWD